ncbi:5-methylthioadenosine/S-adenosylhomocysteine deaminase n1 [Zopfia rhizophila CBS 207.26]|uniref:5-methylthioadenosine/S-adenosylhomocysteine deaminase n1 n=1 Tax=Zopfia rhizophila CBS 207.26 TaxID=1314779 RepID=A0A6A6EE88_9PEZI|nr:5-methylthioadenosine/S-adenosylhomocysteine deaminase n1 [Zopfia rhizophila CBS 207.26]
MSSILLKNGTALLHSANRISKIEKNIKPGGDVKVIDCTDKIISPGFIDTHHHGWQTQLKGRHADELLLNYMVTGNAQSSQFTPTDIFYGQLSGYLEGLAAGTTTIVDHAHLTYSPEHVRSALSATISSGVRSVFCYTPINRIKHWNPITYHENVLEDWVMGTFEELASERKGLEDEGWGGGRVTLGFAWDLWFLGDEVSKAVFRKAHEAGVKTITCHFSTTPQIFGKNSLPELLGRLGLLDGRILLSHANGCTGRDCELMREAGTHVSSTPSTELQMAMGRSICFDASAEQPREIQSHSSLGVDCHSNNASSIILEARLGLQNARNHYNEGFLKDGKTTYKLPQSLSVEAAFNLATIQGARAVGMENKIGSLEVGKKADIVIFDGMSPGMVGAAQHDPTAAVVLHSSPSDIETVIVDGVVRKKEGKLVTVDVDEGVRQVVGRQSLEWRDIAREVVKSRERIQKEIDKLDFQKEKRVLMKALYIDEGVFVDGG